jgi:TM2 domain-containing membrane protein YozV
MVTTISLIVAGVVLSIVIGTLWYMPNTPTGRLHMRYLGFDKLSPEEQKQKIEEAKPTMPKIYAGQMLLSLLMSGAVVFIVSQSLKNGLTFTMAIGFLFINWLCFVVPTVGSHVLWGNCDSKIAWQKFFSDSLNPLVTIIAIAVMVYLVV